MAAVSGLILLMGIGLSSAAPIQETEMPEHHRKWLDEEVVYIISPIEREVFLKLRSDRERELFIQAFWKHRDPTPGNSEAWMEN
jgi:hypothetical protein